MEKNEYESLRYNNPKLPVIFHYDTVYRMYYNIRPHWHEDIEILYFTHGAAKLLINTKEVHAEAGNMVIIPNGALHFVISETECVKYYCLIADHNFYSSYGIDLEEIFFKECIYDRTANQIYEAIVKEFDENAEYYQAQVISSVLSLLVYLLRNHAALPESKRGQEQGPRLDMIKKVLIYIQQNYQKELTTDTLADFIGFNKYYFCHLFKKVTAMTPIFYVNDIRCRKAKDLLREGRVNVSEAAQQCGFENLSYFAKTYKKHIGELPSQTLSDRSEK